MCINECSEYNQNNNENGNSENGNKKVKFQGFLILLYPSINMYSGFYYVCLLSLR